MKKKNTMPDLSGKLFKGESNIHAETVKELTVKGGTEEELRALTKLGWEGQTIGTVTLKTSADGRRVEDGQFRMRGDLTTETIKIQAAKIWEKADEDIMLHINTPPGDRFLFEGGRLYSDYLDQRHVKYQVVKEGRILTEEDKKKHGVGDFSLRVITHLARAAGGSSGAVIKYTVLVHHLGAENIVSLAEATQSPSWPGIKLLEGQCQMFPPAKPGAWGAPIFPLLDISDRAAAVEAVPEGDRLRFAIANIMGTAARPTGCISSGGLMKYVKRMTEDPDAAEPIDPTITWPVAEQPGEEIGKICT